MKRKACRRQVKAELRETVETPSFQQDVRRAWISARCRACGKCPKHIAKLPAPMSSKPGI